MVDRAEVVERTQAVTVVKVFAGDVQAGEAMLVTVAGEMIALVVSVTSYGPGVGEALLREAVRVADERGLPLSMVMSRSYGYPARLGFAAAGSLWRRRARVRRSW